MIRAGTVIRIDYQTKSGVIRDLDNRKEFFFSAVECENEDLPPLFSTVTYIKDTDYVSTDVACLIKLDRLPHAV